jgi:cytochrome c oxidase subunit 4
MSIDEQTTPPADEVGSVDVDEHESIVAPHEPSDGNYVLIAFALMVLTAAEVAASYLDFGSFLIPLLIIMMSIKFLVVVFYFMHLKFDNRIFTWLFFTGLVLAIGVYIAALATFHFFVN